MSNYSNFASLLKSYCKLHNLQTEIELTVKEASLDTENKKYVFTATTSALKTISMDNIAQDIIRNISYKNTKWIKDSPASVDSFLIDKNGKWYFIEFKNQKISKTKQKCIEKSYANIYWLLSILYEMKNQGEIIQFNYENPIQFIKENCNFILVIPKDADPICINKIREAKKAKLPYPEECLFLNKLKSYIFNDASIFDETQFNEKFIKTFSY